MPSEPSRGSHSGKALIHFQPQVPPPFLYLHHDVSFPSRPGSVPKQLRVKVFEILGQWAFMELEEEMTVWDLDLLIRSLQCHALMAAHALVLEDNEASAAAMKVEGLGREDLFRDLLDLASKTTEATSLADVATYEEYLQLLLLYRQHVKLEEVEVKETPPATETPDKATTAQGGSVAGGSGAAQGGQQRQEGAGAAPPAPPPEPQIHPLAIQLAEMGFPLNWCQRALQETVRGGSGRFAEPRDRE